MNDIGFMLFVLSGVKLDECHDLDGSAKVRAAVLADVAKVNVAAVDIVGTDELAADAALGLIATIPSETVLGWRWRRELCH